jgi:hypothetical protein
MTLDGLPHIDRPADFAQPAAAALRVLDQIFEAHATRRSEETGARIAR